MPPASFASRARRARPLASLALVAGLLVVAGCGGDSGVPVNERVPEIDLEANAGFQFHEHTYTVPGTGASRTLRMHLWYATNDATGQSTRFNTISRDEHSFLDASVRVPSGRAPLMVYSHGHLAWGGSNHRLARQFVKNGWIVIAPDHTGNTLTDNIDPRPFEFDVVRAYDMRATIDFAESLPEDHPLYGHIDTSRVLVVGHSYGGKTSWIVGGPTLDLDAIEAECDPGCAQTDLDAFSMYEFDTRVVGIVPLDGGVGADRVADAGFAAMTIPVLYMTKEGDEPRALFDRSAGADVTWLEFAEACHESFTGTFDCPTLELERSLVATATYALSFGASTVLQSGDPGVAAILDGTTEVDPAVSYAHHD